jgi:hypothetical protein
MQPQIADALDGFMEEIHAEEECKIDRTQSLSQQKSILKEEEEDSIQAARAYMPPRMKSRPGSRSSFRPQSFTLPHSSNAYKQCIVCKLTGKKRFNHSLAECDLISLAEKRHAIRSLTVTDDTDDLELLSLDQQDE